MISIRYYFKSALQLNHRATLEICTTNPMFISKIFKHPLFVHSIKREFPALPETALPGSYSSYSWWCKSKGNSTRCFQSLLSPKAYCKYMFIINLNIVAWLVPNCTVILSTAHILFSYQNPLAAAALLPGEVSATARIVTMFSIFSVLFSGAWHSSNTVTRLLTTVSKFNFRRFSDGSCVHSFKPCSCMNLLQSCPQASKLRFC